MSEKEFRDIMVRQAFCYLGTPYRWGGDDPMTGFDCSGFVVELLKSVGLIKRNADYTASGLFGLFAKIQEGTRKQPGDLVFWKNKNGAIVHVEMYCGTGVAIGASSGSSKTMTVADAAAQNAFIKIRPIESRAGFCKFKLY